MATEQKAKHPNKFTVDTENERVTLWHTTKTSDGEIYLKTVFDISKVDEKTRLKRIADAEVISWRARSGIKDLTTAEAMKEFHLQKGEDESFAGVTVDCSIVPERKKHVETPKEKAIREKVKALLGNKNVDMDALMAKLDALKAEAEAQDEMETGEEQ